MSAHVPRGNLRHSELLHSYGGKEKMGTAEQSEEPPQCMFDFSYLLLTMCIPEEVKLEQERMKFPIRI